MFPMFWCECECCLIETRWHALDLTPWKACRFKFSPNLTNQSLASHNGLQSQNSLRNMCLDWSNDILHVINFLLDTIYHYREPVWEFDTTFTRHRVVAFFLTAFAWSENYSDYSWRLNLCASELSMQRVELMGDEEKGGCYNTACRFMNSR